VADRFRGSYHLLGRGNRGLGGQLLHSRKSVEEERAPMGGGGGGGGGGNTTLSCARERGKIWRAFSSSQLKKKDIPRSSRKRQIGQAFTGKGKRVKVWPGRKSPRKRTSGTETSGAPPSQFLGGKKGPAADCPLDWGGRGWEVTRVAIRDCFSSDCR